MATMDVLLLNQLNTIQRLLNYRKLVFRLANRQERACNSLRCRLKIHGIKYFMVLSLIMMITDIHNIFCEGK